MSDRIKLHTGMLLLSPEDSDQGAMVYGAASPTKLVSYHRGIKAESNLRDPFLPDGWCILNPLAVAEHLGARSDLGDLVEVAP